MNPQEYFEKHGALVEQLAQAAEQIPPGKEGWRPCEKALPWLRLVDHMSVSRRGLILKALKGEAFDVATMVKDVSLRATTSAEAAKAQRETWAELKTYIESQGEGFPAEMKLFTRGRQWPASRILWFSYDENLHHRGQLWIYARINGLVPPKVWGTEGVVE